jgi:hypothetical protein
MLHRSIATAIAIVTAAMLLPSDRVVARSGGGGGGHAGAFGFSHPAAPQFGARRFFPSSRAGLHFHNRLVAGVPTRAAHRRSFQLALPGGGWLYGTYDDMFGLTDAYGVETTSPAVEPNFLPPAIYRPACRLQTQIRSVPSESGGRRNIAITRCVHPDVWARPAGSDSGPYAADGNRPDEEAEEAFDITSASTVAAGLRAPGVARVGGCRSETRTVPAEDGGKHEVTITRC